MDESSSPSTVTCMHLQSEDCKFVWLDFFQRLSKAKSVEMTLYVIVFFKGLFLRITLKD